MAIKEYTVDSVSWTPITNLGESGTLWLQGIINGNAGFEPLLVYHKIGTAPDNADESVLRGAFRYTPDTNLNPLPITADTTQDIFYARATKEDIIVIVDVI